MSRIAATQAHLEATLPGGTTVGEINAWLASLYRGKKATKVAPPRPVATVGQTFLPDPEARATTLTLDEAQFLTEEDTEFTRNQVRDLMRADNRVGVCG